MRVGLQHVLDVQVADQSAVVDGDQTLWLQTAADVLVPGGLFALEVDTRRASVTAELVMRERRFRSVRIELDLTGRERFVLARRQEKHPA